MKKSAYIILCFLILLSLSSSIGHFSNEINRAFAILFFIVFITVFIEKKSIFYNRNTFWKVIISLIIFALLNRANFIHESGWMLWYIIVLFWIEKHQAEQNSELKGITHVLVFTSVIYVIWFLAYTNIPCIWQLCHRYSLLLSHNISLLMRKRFLYGGSAINIHLHALLFVFLVISFLCSTKRTILRYLFVVSIFLVFQILAIISQNVLAGIARDINPYQIVTPIDFIFVSILLSSPVIYYVVHFLKVRDYPLPGSFNINLNVAISWLLFSIGIILVFLPGTTLKSEDSKSIMIYNKGYLSFNKPNNTSYGLRSVGMFGMLPDYLESLGYTVKIDSIVTAPALEEVQTFVVINLDKRFSEKEKKDILKFVDNGGSLLVLGDHTGLAGIREPINHLIEGTGIEIRFDCGHYIKNEWGNALDFHNHPATNHLKESKEAGISVGASLRMRNFNVKPLITAKYGFSDIGNMENKNNAYLGDRRFNDHEMLGDVVLVAEVNKNKGKILVFGDTSTLQNGTLFHDYRFVDKIFQWLRTSEIKNGKYIFWILGLLIVAVSFYYSEKKGFLIHGKYNVMLLCTVAMIIWTRNYIINAQVAEHVPQGKIAFVDQSHINRFELYGDQGIWALNANLMRNGYLPFKMDSFNLNLLESSQYLFIVTPALKYSSLEIDRIDEFMNKGGILFWSVGYEEKEPSMNFLQRYGIDLDNVPLGPVSKDHTTDAVQFVEAWPVLFDTEDDFEILCQAWEYPVIVRKRIGNGKLIVIGDSYFLLSRNLELTNTYYPENIKYLKILLEDN